MAWLTFGGGDLPKELALIRSELADLRMLAALNLGADMATNDELTDINAKLDEAAAELGGLPAQIEELLSQVGDQADPALVASIKAKAQALADIVPNAPVEEPAEPEAPVDPEPPVTEDGGDVVADEPTA